METEQQQVLILQAITQTQQQLAELKSALTIRERRLEVLYQDLTDAVTASLKDTPKGKVE